MHETVDRVVTPFLAAADAALGAGYSALLYGSAARGDYLAGRSNINLMLVLDDPSPTRLRALAPAFAAWRKTASEPPLLISRAEWARATDVFPIEITDMRAGYRVLRGADPLGGARVQGTDLRQALERELRGKLLRLRQGYAAAAGDEKLLGQAAALVGVPAAGLVTPVERRGERGWRCTASEFEQYMDAVARAAGYVDQLQLGDQ
jgi:predicted nucleotidyltransferase